MAKLTYRAAADQLRVAPSTISNAERGHFRADAERMMKFRTWTGGYVDLEHWLEPSTDSLASSQAATTALLENDGALDALKSARSRGSASADTDQPLDAA